MSFHTPSITCLFVAAAIALGGCGTGQDRSSATTATTASVPVNVTTAKSALSHTLVALKSVRDSTDAADLKQRYGVLKTDRDHLESALAAVLATSKSAIDAGNAQITQWHRQADTFTDPDLRNSSNKREADLRQAVDALTMSRARCASVSDAFRSQLSQTVKALDLDLSMSGVKSVKPVIGKLLDASSDLRSSLDDVSSKSDAVHTVVAGKN